MRLKVKHLTQYIYSKEVVLQPHHLYFYPAHRNYLNLESFDIQVNPHASGLSFRTDIESNAFHQCWFNDPIKELTVVAEFIVETHPINPFDFIVEEPVGDPTPIQTPYLQQQSLSSNLSDWLNDVVSPAGNNMVTLLTFLASEIHENWEHTIRYEPTIMPPDECFSSKKGSCRDLSWMMIQMLRSINIPARFVSGYGYNPNLGEGHELHAWVEVLLPGAGWIGVDPNSGLLATDRYIPVAASYLPRNTFPIQGSYFGDASSELKFEVTLEQL